MAEEYGELVSNMSTVEDALVEYVAEESLDESFLGEAAVGTVENVLLDESDSFVRFELRLPTGRLGSVSFSEYDMSRGCVELFFGVC